MSHSTYQENLWTSNAPRVEIGGFIPKRFLAAMLCVMAMAAAALSQERIRTNPTVVITPARQSGFAGHALTYRVTVTNNDSTTSSFVGMANFPEPDFKHVPACFRMTLRPGETASRDVLIQSPPKSCDGPKTFRETVVNESAPSFSGFADAIFDVVSLSSGCQFIEDAASSIIKIADTQVRSQVAPALITAAAIAGVPIQASRLIYETQDAAIAASVPISGTESLTPTEFSNGANLSFVFLCSSTGTFLTPARQQVPNGFYTVKVFKMPNALVARIQLLKMTGEVVADFVQNTPPIVAAVKAKVKIVFRSVPCPPDCRSIIVGSPCVICFEVSVQIEFEL